MFCKDKQKGRLRRDLTRLGDRYSPDLNRFSNFSRFSATSFTALISAWMAVVGCLSSWITMNKKTLMEASCRSVSFCCRLSYLFLVLRISFTNRNFSTCRWAFCSSTSDLIFLKLLFLDLLLWGFSTDLQVMLPSSDSIERELIFVITGVPHRLGFSSSENLSSSKLACFWVTLPRGIRIMLVSLPARSLILSTSKGEVSLRLRSTAFRRMKCWVLCSSPELIYLSDRTNSSNNFWAEKVTKNSGFSNIHSNDADDKLVLDVKSLRSFSKLFPAFLAMSSSFSLISQNWLSCKSIADLKAELQSKILIFRTSCFSFLKGESFTSMSTKATGFTEFFNKN